MWPSESSAVELEDDGKTGAVGHAGMDFGGARITPNHRALPIERIRPASRKLKQPSGCSERFGLGNLVLVVAHPADDVDGRRRVKRVLECQQPGVLQSLLFGSVVLNVRMRRSIEVLLGVDVGSVVSRDFHRVRLLLCGSELRAAAVGIIVVKDLKKRPLADCVV